MTEFWGLLMALGAIAVPLLLAGVLLGRTESRKVPRPGSPVHRKR